jgi:hypothetical protein
MKLVMTNRKIDQAKAAMFSLGIASLVTAVMWIGISVYFSYTKTTIDTGINALIKPINPNLDQEAVKQYRDSRISIPEVFPVMALIKDGSRTRVEAIEPNSITETKTIQTNPKPAEAAPATTSAQLAE